jgi:hypothetical protein
LRDKEAQEAELAAQVAIERFSSPEADPPATNSSETGVESVTVSLDSDVEVGSTGNINTIPVLPTESAAYHQVAGRTQLEELIEALPFCETVKDFTCVIEGYSVELVSDAIAMQDTQPRRRQLSQWLESLTAPASLPELRIGSLLERMSGLARGKVAVILQVFGDWLETSLGTVAWSEIESGSWRLKANSE